MSNKSRFALAQRGRTLNHPLLPQPPTQYEEKSFYYQDDEYCMSNVNLTTNNNNASTSSSSASSTVTATPSLVDISDDENDEYDDQEETTFLHATSTSTLMVLTNTLIHTTKATVTATTATTTTTATVSPHPTQHTEMIRHSPTHSFVILADTQIGMTSLNQEWETELSYFRQAVKKINELQPRPKFVSACGDLVDMEHTFYSNNPKALMQYEYEECERIQDQQNEDFKKVFQEVHPDIALVCLCGNHDIGNRPTPKSINKFRDAFGDEYFAFWTNGTYNIVLNNVLFTNPTGAQEIFEQQLVWLEQRLQYANQYKASQIFIFAHHPWFLYNEDEDVPDLMHHGSAFPSEWDFDGSGKFNNQVFPDSYFSVPKTYRKIALDLFHKYKVSACFSGHFHQNLISKSSQGMDMIVTAPLSMVFDSTGKSGQKEVNTRGIRVVTVEVPQVKTPDFQYCMPCGVGGSGGSNDDDDDKMQVDHDNDGTLLNSSESLQERHHLNSDVTDLNGGMETEMKVNDGRFSHQFVSI